MKVMIDTNVILSALFFPQSKPAQAMILVAQEHELVLCPYIIEEVKEKIATKRPDLLAATDALLLSLAYTEVRSNRTTSRLIIDQDDAPILNAAIAGDVDIIISGDKHFLSLDIVKPAIMNPATFLVAYS
jgi:putative PIN family toxin of toxin-antitoxin system